MRVRVNASASVRVWGGGAGRGVAVGQVAVKAVLVAAAVVCADRDVALERGVRRLADEGDIDSRVRYAGAGPPLSMGSLLAAVNTHARTLTCAHAHAHARAHAAPAAWNAALKHSGSGKSKGDGVR